MSFWSSLGNIGKGLANTALGAVTGGALKPFNVSDPQAQKAMDDQNALLDKQIKLAQLQGAASKDDASSHSDAGGGSTGGSLGDFLKSLKLPALDVNAKADNSSLFKIGGIILVVLLAAKMLFGGGNRR